MKKSLLFFFTFIICSLAFGQTFTGAGGTIPDNNTSQCFNIPVTGIGPINTTYGLASVCININHTFDADLEIYLQSPQGTFVELSTNNGGSGDNYTGTCFNMSAATSITAGFAPFTGSFKPEGVLGAVNNGSNADGTWKLCITDGSPGIQGSLVSWSITFNNTPAPVSNNGSVCDFATPFCTSSFPILASPTNNPNGIGGGGIFGCLDDTPNPTWYFLQIGNSGNLIIDMHQQTPSTATPPNEPIDVDYAVWGPFTSLADGCSQLENPSPTITPISCSFSPDPDETATINGAISGQYYIMLVTNFDGSPGNITFTLNSAATSTTNCDIVCNAAAFNNGPICSGNTFNLTGSSTSPGATYTWAGPSGFTSGVQSPTGVSAPAAPGNYVYTLTVHTATSTCTSPTTVVVGSPSTVSISNGGNVCPNGNAVFTLTGTANAVVSYNINGGATQTITLSASGTATVTVPGITANTTLATTSITAASTVLTENGLIATGGTNPANATGAIAAAGTVPSTTNSASLSGGNPSLVINLQHTVPAGTAIIVSLSRNTAAGAATITDGTTIQSFNAGPDNILQRVTFLTGAATSSITINRTAGQLWIDGLQYNYTLLGCTNAAAQSNTVSINTSATPTFNAVAPICAGATLSPLPLTSNNGISGTWSPAINNTATTTYTFTPTTGQCASTAALTITVNPKTLPTFTAAAPICSGAALAALPVTSNNGIPGTWSPAINNTATTTYTFTPATGQCALTTTMTITVNTPVTPTFTAIAPVCSGSTFTLPATSNNGIPGTWSPAINNTATTAYTFTPATGQCATTATMTVTVNPIVAPTFTAISPICSGTTLTLPATSNNGISGTWSPAINNTATTTYMFTPTAGQCASTTTLTVTVNPQIVPTFTAVAPICSGTALAPLPLTSNNSINGTWSPAINNTATTTYTFTPTAGQCASTAALTITVNPPVTPIFTAVAPICSGATLPPLPLTSVNGISGTWSPALNNTATTTYTFTPTTGLCATITTLTITVNPIITPTFTQIAPVCSGTSFTLPATSNNGITGTWSPAINTTGTTTYTFTPAAGQCATTAGMTVTVNPIIAPTFAAIAPICSGSTLALPATSNNGISGTWSPAVNNTATTTYTFTPTAGQCASTATLTVTVNPQVVPTFTTVAPICSGAPLAALPTSSNNGISGTWLPALNNTATTTYTFTPTTGQCATTATLTITVNPIIAPTFTAVAPACSGATLSALPLNSNNGISGTWSPALNNTATTVYTFTPTAGQCASTTTMTVTINPVVTPVFTAIPAICSGGAFSLPATSNNGIAGTWAPALDNTATTTYTFTPAAGQCATTATLTVTVNPNVLPTFTAVAPICAGSTLAPLPLTSNNGISGTWSPAVNNAATTTYTFTPTAGLCALPTTMAITVNPIPAAPAVVSPVAYCTNAAALPLTATGTNLLWYASATGGTGSVNAPTPATTPAGNTDFFVTQSAAGCESPRAKITVTVNAPAAITLATDTTICQGDTLRLAPTVVPAADTYQWTAADVLQSTILNSHVKDAVIITENSSDYILKATLNGCAAQATINVKVLWKPIVDAGQNVPICINDSTLLTGNVLHISGFADSLAWTPTDSIRPVNATGSNNIQSWAHPVRSQWYRLTAYTTKAGYGCAFEVYDSVKVVVHPPINAFAGNDTIAVKGLPHQLYGSGGVFYSWSSPTVTISNPTLQNPTAVLNNDANFYLTVKDAIGCEGRDTVFIKVYNGSTYYVPTAFSPNGDGLNDVFRPIPVGIANTQYFKVFNRYGEVVFETNKWLKGWDGTFKGKPQPSGTYVWMLKGQDRDGKTVEMKGSVLIIK